MGYGMGTGSGWIRRRPRSTPDVTAWIRNRASGCTNGQASRPTKANSAKIIAKVSVDSTK